MSIPPMELHSAACGGTAYRRECFRYVALLRACAKSRDLGRGSRAHAKAMESGLVQSSPHIASASINMYAHCGDLQKAREVLEELPIRTVVTWSALISGYVRESQGHAALACFEAMQIEGISPDVVTYASVLKACSDIRAAEEGDRIHREIMSLDLLRKDAVLAAALVDMHAKCGNLTRARHVLDELPFRDEISWSALIAGFAKEELHQDAIACFERMQIEGLCPPDAITCSCILKVCGSIGGLEKGKQIHSRVSWAGFLGSDVVLGTALVAMYAKCGALADAQSVLENLPVRSLISWNAILSGYAQHSLGHHALCCLRQMQNEGLSPNAVTFISIFKACGSIRAIEEGRRFHGEIVSKGLSMQDLTLANALIDMYAKCAHLAEAHRVLEDLPIRDSITWNALIEGYAREGKDEEALDCFEKMQDDGITPDATTFACILKSCGKLRAVEKGEEIHQRIAARSLLTEGVLLGNALVGMYARCGRFGKAQMLLEELPSTNTCSWNALMAEYVQHGRGQEALDCFARMQREGFFPDAATFISIMKGCGVLGDTEMGKQIHAMVLSKGMLEKDIALGNALVHMYARCGVPERAARVLDELHTRDVIGWNAVIAGYAQQGKGHDALAFFQRMQNEGISPDVVTFTCILKACAIMENINKGEQIHEEVISKGWLKKGEKQLAAAVIDMYAKCGMVGKAWQVLQEFPLRDRVCWNALIAGFAQQGMANETSMCLGQMQSEGLSPDTITLTCILMACGHTQDIDKGHQIHEEIVRRGFRSDDVILGNALIDMYAKCGMLRKAEDVMKEIPVQNIVSWSTLVARYADLNQGHEALECFGRMRIQGLTPNTVTYICLLKACGQTGAIELGKTIHEEVVHRNLLDKDIALGNAVIDMYARCDMLAKAQETLEGLPTRNVVTWNALIGGYAQQGQGHEALKCFEQMQSEGMHPNDVTFLSMLCACGHSGLAKETGILFESMTLHYGITPNLKHQTCMVVVFGFKGQFDDAISVIKAMPSPAASPLVEAKDPSVWLALLNACRKWGNVELGRSAFDQTMQLDQGCAAAYVFMANIFTVGGMREDAESIETMRVKYAMASKHASHIL